MRRYHALLAVGWRLVDALMVFALLPLLCTVFGVSYNQPYQIAAILGALLTWVAMGAVNAYRPWRSASFGKEFATILTGWLIAVAGLLFVFWAVKHTTQYSRLVIGSWFVAAPLMLALAHLGGRAFLRALRRRGRNTRTAVIVGAGDLGRELAGRILDAD
ncbi:MAG: undecaprenyl-phosphate glucose phosphotransferase, partial [Zetaproteobacteria bacterium]